MKRKKAKRRERRELPIHRLLISLRAGSGMTQVEAAAAIGVHKTTVNHWETFSAQPSLSQIPGIAKAYVCKVDKLLHAMLESAA